MKKILTAATLAAIALTSLSSCCGKGSSCADGSCQADTALSKATIDSISMTQGAYIGQAVLSNFPAMAREGIVNKEDIIKGVQLAFGAGDNRATTLGIQFGLQMLNEIKQLNDMGIDIDRTVMLNNFKKAFLKDSVDQQEAQQTYTVYQGMVNRVQEERKAREEARIAASPEALKNVADGEAYVAAVMAGDDAVKTTDSGLAYKIETVGDGKPVQGANRLKVKYTEKTIDGTEIVKTSDSGRTTYLTNVNPGFAEGLNMLAKGGKAVFYVPGKLAYGVNGIPTRNVGPNVTIVYDVEVMEVE